MANNVNIYISMESTSLRATITSEEKVEYEPMMVKLDYLNEDHMEVYNTIQKGNYA